MRPSSPRLILIRGSAPRSAARSGSVAGACCARARNLLLDRHRILVTPDRRESC